MNIDKTIAELELKHLIESLLELDLKDKQVTTYGMPHGMNSYSNDQFVKDWSDKNIGKFIELLDCLGIDDPSFCCIPLWGKMVSKDREMPVDTVYCYKLKNRKTSMSELKLDKNEEFTILNRFDVSDSVFPDAFTFFTMLHIAINENLMLNRPKVLEQYPFMKKILQMFNNY